MQFFPFSFEPRHAAFVGRSGAKKARARGFIPGNFCSKDGKAQSIQLKAVDLWKLFQSAHVKNPVITIDAPKTKFHGKKAICRYLEVDPISQKPWHVEFYEINANEKIEVTVPVRIIGKSPDQATGALIDIIAHELIVECMPDKIPEYIEVDVSNLHKGHAIHVEEIKMPPGIDYAGAEHVTIVSCHMPHREEEPVKEVAEPEVIGEKAASEEGAAPAATGTDSK